MSQSSIGLLYKIPIEVDRMCSIEFYRNHVPKFYRTLIEVDRIFFIEFYRVFFVGKVAYIGWNKLEGKGKMRNAENSQRVKCGGIGGDLAPRLGDGQIFCLPRFLNSFLGKYFHFNTKNFL